MTVDIGHVDQFKKKRKKKKMNEIYGMIEARFGWSAVCYLSDTLLVVVDGGETQRELHFFFEFYI